VYLLSVSYFVGIRWNLEKPLGLLRVFTKMFMEESWFHLRSRRTFRRNQRCPESDVHVHLVENY